jgi:hypothetical protein
MPAATLPRPATIRQTQGRRWWKCHGCGRTLGEVVGDRVIIKVGDRWIRLPAVPGLELECPVPQCRETSVLEGQ